jgi:hypothetical protein
MKHAPMLLIILAWLEFVGSLALAFNAALDFRPQTPWSAFIVAGVLGFALLLGLAYGLRLLEEIRDGARKALHATEELTRFFCREEQP